MTWNLRIPAYPALGTASGWLLTRVPIPKLRSGKWLGVAGSLVTADLCDSSPLCLPDPGLRISGRGSDVA